MFIIHQIHEEITMVNQPKQLSGKNVKLMLGSRIFHAAQPYISALAVALISTIIVSIIYLTQDSLQWITFLTGILVASILAAVARMSHAEWMVLRRTEQLASVKDKLEHETQLHKNTEEELAACKPLMQLINETNSLMVAFVDTEGRYQYHNQAFRKWLNLRPERINGRPMREVVGAKNYVEIAAAARQSLAGQVVRYDQRQNLPNGSIVLVSTEHIPQFALDGKVSGFYILATVVTENGTRFRQTEQKSSATQNIVTHGGRANQDMFVNSFSNEITGQSDEGKQILAAIERGEFKLFCQTITPLAANSGDTEHYEILLRLMEEEDNMLPPGAFFPLAEKYGLMPQLDRWVLQHVLEHISCQKQPANSMFFINLSLDTISDPGFPDFLDMSLLKYDVSGVSLCFEIPNSELSFMAAQLSEFARQVKQCGCSIALSGFGRDRVFFDQIHDFGVAFLKIDGSVILDILHDPVKLAKVVAINRVAKKIGIKTIAELVESEGIIAKLKELNVDFAQGFGISRPQLLE